MFANVNLSREDIERLGRNFSVTDSQPKWGGDINLILPETDQSYMIFIHKGQMTATVTESAGRRDQKQREMTTKELLVIIQVAINKAPDSWVTKKILTMAKNILISKRESLLQEQQEIDNVLKLMS